MDLKLLLKAQEFYTSKGFKNMDVPWVVKPAISKITKPIGNRDFILDVNVGEKFTKREALIASGEQGFLQLTKYNNLPKGFYQTLTPCFRDEPFYDIYHQLYFYKIELYATDMELTTLEYFIECAKEFFEQEKGKLVEIIDTGNNTFDINYNGIEIGSYGIREHEGMKWTYGTGLALPRFNLV